MNTARIRNSSEGIHLYFLQKIDSENDILKISQ